MLNRELLLSCHAGCVVVSDGNNIRCGEFCRSLSFSMCASAVLMCVIAVGLVTVPTQIRQGVIKRIAVVVAAHHPSRTRADECKQNKRVDAIRLMVQPNCPVSLWTLQCHSSPLGREVFAMIAAPYRAVIANSITEAPWNVAILNCSLCRSHEMFLCKKGRLWIGPAGVQPSVRPASLYHKLVRSR